VAQLSSPLAMMRSLGATPAWRLLASSRTVLGVEPAELLKLPPKRRTRVR
jgi:hypothetical protein